MRDGEDGSVIDEETGLPNRAGWDCVLEAEEQRARRHGGVHGLVAVTLEPTATAGLVEQVADALMQQLRDTDHVARVDHRTFGVLALYCDSLGTMVGRIRTALESNTESPVLAWIDARAAGPDLRAAWAEMTDDGEVEQSRSQVRYADFVVPSRPCLN